MDDLAISHADVLPEFPAEPAAAAGAPAPPMLHFADLHDLALSVEVPLGSVDLDLRTFLELSEGSVLQTDRQTGEPLEITVNGTPIARGEVRIHGEWFAIRVTEILRASPKRDVQGEPDHAHRPASQA
ncbi:FliM/FliN family flagellar motor switch protein [bacterium]|nr:FliM/FliN family flagellar motor switch protein [bacterium]